ncbi:ERCC4 domain-containing protein [Candidatus Pacearchaeota archaeon]|nr:ERCC4 domain-containing protein [Candidatus Pacearchaeota archaeon]
MTSVRKVDIHWRYKIPAKITIQVDTREQFPLLFPDNIFIGHPELTYKTIPIEVVTEKIKLECGDYRIKEYPTECIVERKASQLEIFKNLNESHDRIRQAKAFRRLVANCKHPTLLIEASPSELLSGNPHIKNPELVAHRLSLAIAKYGFHVIFLPWKSRNNNTRRKAGTLLLHLMMGYTLSKTFDVPPVLLGEE